MQSEHRKELDSIYRTSQMKIIYGLGILSDVVDGDMTGEERNIHVNDAKEIILEGLTDAGLFQKG